jgi:hypothetical protein
VIGTFRYLELWTRGPSGEAEISGTCMGAIEYLYQKLRIPFVLGVGGCVVSARESSKFFLLTMYKYPPPFSELRFCLLLKGNHFV